MRSDSRYTGTLLALRHATPVAVARDTAGWMSIDIHKHGGRQATWRNEATIGYCRELRSPLSSPEQELIGRLNPK
jgi:hypothetical protein